MTLPDMCGDVHGSNHTLYSDNRQKDGKAEIDIGGSEGSERIGISKLMDEQKDALLGSKLQYCKLWVYNNIVMAMHTWPTKDLRAK